MFHYKTLEEFNQEIAAQNLSIPFGNEAVLREAVTVGGRTIPNRIAIQPMEGCDGTADGKPDELTLRRYDKFAASGADFASSSLSHAPMPCVWITTVSGVSHAVSSACRA